MRRWVIRILSALSLVVFICAGVFWARSYFIIDHVTWASGYPIEIASEGGGVCIQETWRVRREGDWRDGYMKGPPPKPLVEYDEFTMDYAPHHFPPRPGDHRLKWEVRKRGDWPAFMGGVVWPAESRVIPKLADTSQLKSQSVTYGNDRPTPQTRTTEEWIMSQRVWVPYWIVVLLSGVLPLLVFKRWYRQFSRRRNNRCLRCGYDLRASGGRCPECGEAIGEKTVVPTSSSAC